MNTTEPTDDGDALRQFGELPLTADATRQVLESVAGRGVPDLGSG